MNINMRPEDLQLLAFGIGIVYIIGALARLLPAPRTKVYKWEE